MALALWLAPAGVRAQLILDEPNQRWTPGQTIDLHVPRRDDGRALRIEAVFFDGRPVPFDVVRPRSGDEAVRIRIRVPAGIKPGDHEISADFSALTRVPQVVGLSLGEARRALEAQGLALDEASLRADSTELESTTVGRQDPAAGVPVRPGQRVAVTTATEVPDLTGLTFEEARQRLEPRGLPLDTTSLPATRAPVEALRVARYAPAAGAAIATGTPVRLLEAAVTVPDLLGQRIDVARRILLDRGFVPLLTLRDATEGPYETVLSQRPAAGAAAPGGAELTLEIESRPDLPGPRWPVPEAVAVAALATALQRVRTRRLIRRSYRVEAHPDLDRLREQSRSPDLEDRDLGLDLRLLGVGDPGRQTLEVDGPLILGEAAR